MREPVFVPHGPHPEFQRRLSLAHHRLGNACDRLGDGDMDAAEAEVFGAVVLLIGVLPADFAAAARVTADDRAAGGES